MAAVKVALRQALELGEKEDPPVTVVVCKKMHHTRFFPSNPRDAVGKAQNVPPGLVVDRDILHKDDYDFFMMAHAGIQGTCRPIHYSIVHDENKMDVDVIQAITHALSYTYQRCPRAVKVPAPVYYAHLIAERGRVHLRGQI
uniref:Piwi domain-containing protein n=1 Tax=Plectus sambesii TaxID=2011161 RepID=A0A914VEA2_9BILA